MPTDTPSEFLVFPAHALLIVEERLREQEAEGVEVPDHLALDDLALRILIVASWISSAGGSIYGQGRQAWSDPDEELGSG